MKRSSQTLADTNTVSYSDTVTRLPVSSPVIVYRRPATVLYGILFFFFIVCFLGCFFFKNKNKIDIPVFWELPSCAGVLESNTEL